MEDLDASEQVIVDGTLSPCWDWNEQSGLFSGKHRRTGVNLQVIADLTGRLLQVPRPAPGSTHDAKAIKATGLLEHFKNTPPLADKGYVGLGLLTPDRKPAGAELTETQKKGSRVINSLRAAVERAIAHLKTWRILHTPIEDPSTHSLRPSPQSSRYSSTNRLLNNSPGCPLRHSATQLIAHDLWGQACRIPRSRSSARTAER